MLKIIFLGGLTLLSAIGYAQKTRVEGSAATYAGDSLFFKTYSDYITYSEESLSRIKVDSKGNFSTTLKVVEPTFVFVGLGAQRGYFFAEPGKSYTLILPPKVPKTEEDRLNPFFKEESIQLGIANCPKNDINYLTAIFDDNFNQEFSAIAQEIYKKKGKATPDTSIYSLDTIGRKENNPYFNAYKKYRFGLIQHLTMMYKSKGISDKYFSQKPILYQNPSYMELFNQIYDRYFLFFNNPSKEDNVGSSIGAASLTRLKKVLAKDSILRDNKLQELVILKGIHDGFYEDNFSRKNLLILLDSLYFSSTIPEHKYIATNIRDKVIQLLPGYFPPMLKLYDVEGKAVSLDQFKGKFIYLNFCSINSYTCLQDFALLQKIHEKYGNKVEIISISTDPDIEDLKYFVKNKPYKWKFVHYGTNPDIITRYDVRAYPTYFLINPEGKMEVSPAPSPREKLEILLINQLKNKDML